ncbi:uncharacterized protein K02A2.6-like [Phlebotomus papatasi]|uniref:uncharacterized protein K02A2.6-like n=1 Tax=Phlebotomus papatasi TaxID=29031 RepID=UPI0024843FF4|nr:uncharacterized protein K02A2.6-like [Phlebotomus papatasi]
MATNQSSMLTDLVAAIEKLVELKVNERKANVVPAAPSEVSVDALARSITPFTFSPENNMTFNVWYGRFKSTFLEDGKNLDDPARVRLLLRRLDAASYSRYANLLLPQNPSELSFEQNVQKLTKIFGKGESLFSTRRKCLQLVMKDSDDWATHGGIVNSLCEDFRLAECTPSHFKALIFCISMQSEKHVFVREQLLTRLETEPPSKITLEFMIDEAQRLANVKKDSRLDVAPITVNTIRKSPPTTQKKDKPNRPCFLCGGMHFVKECTYTQTKCGESGVVGHKTGYCAPPQRESDSTKKDAKGKKKFFHKKKPQARTNAVFSSHTRGRKFLTPLINGHEIEFQLDCAADVSLITHNTWECIGKPALSRASLNIRDAQSTQIPINGEFECTVKFFNKEIRSRCFVSDAARDNLFGIEWIEGLGLWDERPSAYCNSVQNEIDAQTAVADLQRDFPAVFGREMGLCTKAIATINLKQDAVPIFRPKRPVAFHMLPVIDEELQRLQASGIISPVEYSPWAAPIVVARKANGSIRICGDYSTGLNDSIETNNYPIPDPDSLFSRLSNRKVFSHVDLSDAYLQIPVDEESSKLLTIHTPRGLFKFNRLAPGIRCAPGIFQEVVERMLQGIPDVICYFDDICIASTTPEDHFSTLKKVFQRLDEFNFRVKAEKYSEGLRPDPAKIEAIQKMPSPKNVHELRSFLGALQFWGIFVRSMSELRNPLDILLKKGVPLKWTRQCEDAFTRFKEILGSELLLTHYDPSLPIFVASDASSHAIGCVAYHKFSDGSMKAFYHASRRLTETEARYSQIEKEALGIIFAVKKFHRFLYGRQFTLMTDHKPLVSIFGSKRGIPTHTANRLQRWALILLGYHFNIQYLSTDNFGHADILSRLISGNRQQDDEIIIAQISLEEALDNHTVQDAVSQLPVKFEMIKQATESSPTLQEVSGYIKGGWPASPKNITSREVQSFYKVRDALSLMQNCVFYRDRLVVPETFRSRILVQLHESHPSMARMKALARSYVFWPGLDGDIEHKVRNRTDCATTARSPVKAHLSSWPLSSAPWQRIHLDYAKYKGDYFFLIIDSYSKWPEVFWTSSMTTSTTIQRLTEVFARHGLPDIIVSDNGTQFVSEELQQFCRSNGIEDIHTCPFSPASNGPCERLVGTLKRSLEKQKSQNVDVALQRFLANYRVTPSEIVPQGKSPSEIMYTRRVRTIFDLLKFKAPEPIQRNRKMEDSYNKRHGTKNRIFARGQEVYAKKFAQGGKWTWTPGKVIERRGTVTYNIRLANGIIVRSHINQLRRRYAADFSDSAPLFLLPIQPTDDTTPTQNSPVTPRTSRSGSSTDSESPAGAEALSRTGQGRQNESTATTPVSSRLRPRPRRINYRC